MSTRSDTTECFWNKDLHVNMSSNHPTSSRCSWGYWLYSALIHFRSNKDMKTKLWRYGTKKGQHWLLSGMQYSEFRMSMLSSVIGGDWSLFPFAPLREFWEISKPMISSYQPPTDDSFFKPTISSYQPPVDDSETIIRWKYSRTHNRTIDSTGNIVMLWKVPGFDSMSAKFIFLFLISFNPCVP